MLKPTDIRKNEYSKERIVCVSSYIHYKYYEIVKQMSQKCAKCSSVKGKSFFK